MNARMIMDRLLAPAAVCLILAPCGLRVSADEPAAEKAVEGTAITDVHYVDDLRLFFDEVRLAANADQLGAEVSQVDGVLRSHLGLGEGKGLVVTSVADGGPAAKAGLQKNDVLLTAGGEEIANLDAFRQTLQVSAEKPLVIGLIRGGKKESLDVTPLATECVAEVAPNWTNDRAPKYWLGVGLAPADDTLRSQLSLPAGESLVVTSVEDDSPAAQAGVMVNDVLLQLDDKALTTVEALTEQLQSVANRSVSLKLLRRGKPATLTVTPAEHSEAANWQLLEEGSYYNTPYVVSVQYPQTVYAHLYQLATQAKPDVAEQLDALQGQLTQLETSLAALRTSLGLPAQTSQGQPTQSAGEAEQK